MLGVYYDDREGLVARGILAAPPPPPPAAEGASDGDEASAPSSMALLTGRVVAHRVLTNEETGDTFHWLLVKSLEASYDIVADPAVVKGPLGVDAVVRIGGAFFGRIL